MKHNCQALHGLQDNPEDMEINSQPHPDPEPSLRPPRPACQPAQSSAVSDRLQKPHERIAGDALQIFGTELGLVLS